MRCDNSDPVVWSGHAIADGGVEIGRASFEAGWEGDKCVWTKDRGTLTDNFLKNFLRRLPFLVVFRPQIPFDAFQSTSNLVEILNDEICVKGKIWTQICK